MAIVDHLQKLEEGVSAWNKWRNQNPDIAPDLSAADLRDAELQGANLHGTNLDQCDLRDAILDGADLTLASLSRANLSGAILTSVNLAGVQGKRPNFAGANATGADFSDSKLGNAAFQNSILNRAVFIGSVLKDSQFDSASLRGADLRTVDFRDSVMSNVDFGGALANGSDFRRCVLASASFREANFSETKLRSADFTNANLENMKLTNADLRSVKGLTCDRLIQATDWETAIRDEALACDAAIPEEADSTSPTEDTGAEPSDLTPSVDSFFESELSIWRDDVEESDRQERVKISRKALVDLEKALEETRERSQRGQIGDNNPPEAVISDELVGQYVAEIRVGIALHDAPRPDKIRLGQLRNALKRFHQWIQLRIDKAVDAAAIVIGTSAGAYLAEKLFDAIEALDAFIKLFQ